MKRIGITLPVLLFIWMNGVAQESKNMNTAIDSTKNARPYYAAQIYSSNCKYEVRVNDMLVDRYFRLTEGIRMQFPINHNILESGIQTIEIKIFPKSGEDKLNKYSTFDLEIQLYKDVDDVISEYESVLTYTLDVPEEGVPFVNYSEEFYADVPYKLEGWKNSVRLSDIENVEEKIWIFYKEIWEALKQKDIKVLNEMSKKKYSEYTISSYKGREGLNEFYIKSVNEEGAVIQSIDSAKLVYYAEKRVVSLEMEDGESAFQFVIKSDDGEESKEEYIYFYFIIHLPEEGGDFEVIR